MSATPAPSATNTAPRARRVSPPRASAGLLALWLAACAPAPDGAPASTLTAAIEQASARYGVPADVLLAVAYAEGRWAEPGAHPADADPAHGAVEVGPLHLRHDPVVDTLHRAGALLRVDERALRAGDLALHVAAAAAVLADLGAQTGARAEEPDTWAEAVARYSGIRGRAAQVEYAREVWAALREGRRAQAFTGETVLLRGRPGPDIETLLRVETAAQHSDDYPPALWVPAHAANYPGPRTGPIRYVIIHDTEGSYASAISWFQTPPGTGPGTRGAGVGPSSAHYVFRSSDGQLTQMVRDRDVAWHSANRCIQDGSIGIEHEGYAEPEERARRYYTEAMYRASARLVRHLCDRYSIPIDRDHIFGHYEVYGPSSSMPHTCPRCVGTWSHCMSVARNSTDPGPYWDWARYLDMVRAAAPAGPAYAATHVGQSYPAEMTSGQRAVAYVEFRNTGTASWDTTRTRLGTTNPRDHAGALFDMENWLSPTRPTAVDATTAPGAVGRFSFMVRAPEVAAPVTITESFALVQEGTGWFGPTEVRATLTIRVRPAAGDAGARDAAGDVAPRPDDDAAVPPGDAAVDHRDAADRDAGTTSAPDAAPRADAPGSRDAGTPEPPRPVGCGCAVPRGARGGCTGLALLALMAALSARARRRVPGTLRS